MNNEFGVQDAFLEDLACETRLHSDRCDKVNCFYGDDHKAQIDFMKLQMHTLMNMKILTPEEAANGLNAK